MNILTRCKIGRFIRDEFFEQNLSLIHKVNFNGLEYVFTAPHRIPLINIRSYFGEYNVERKWIDSFDSDSIFWDFGGNIGLSTVYAGKVKDSKVYVFEPWLLNLDCLCRNIISNELEEKVIIVPTPTSIVANDKKISDTFIKLTATEDIEEFSTQNFKKLSLAGFSYVNVQMLSFKLDELISKRSLIHPNYLNIDYQGLEYLLLNKKLDIFSQIRSLLIKSDLDIYSLNTSVHSQLLLFGLEMSETKLDENKKRYEVWNRKE